MFKHRHTSLRKANARYVLSPTLVGSCVLIDLLADNSDWPECSAKQLELPKQRAPLVSNSSEFAQISPRYERAADPDALLARFPIKRDALLTRHAFRIDLTRKSAVHSPITCFCIGSRPENLQLTPRGASPRWIHVACGLRSAG